MEQAEINRTITDRLVLGHQHLCQRGARKFLRSGLERVDLEQVAAIGLIKASRNFEVSAGTPFEAYAWLMIVGELMHYVRDHERPIRIPRRLRALEPHYNRAQDACTGRLGREPNDAEIASEMGVLTHTVAELRRARDCALVVGIDEAAELAARSESTLEAEDRFLFVDAFARLKPLERQLVVGVYLLGLSRLQLARRLHIPARRVSRVLQSALACMQRALAS